MSGDARVCTRCVSDTTIPDIRFDAAGECNFCKVHDALDRLYPLDARGEAERERLLGRIRRAGRGRPHNCVVGMSGGTDSTYTLYLARQLGLRPLGVHLDNTWNTETAEENMQKAADALDVPVRRIECHWPEFRALQRAFLEASVPEAEIPTDVAIHAVLHDVAADEGIRYVLNGHSFRTEGVAPIGWTYMDGRYIRSVYRQFTGERLRHFPNLTLSRYLYYTMVKGVKGIPFLNYFAYTKTGAREVLQDELGWTYYGGHHFESIYTRFVIARVLYGKFGIDKRKINFSAHVRSGLMDRQDALDRLREPPTVPDETVAYVLDRLGLDEPEFEAIMQAPPKCFRDYPTYYPMLRAMRPLLKAATWVGLVHPVLYMKFFG
jgi:N-acetyl sugar amidotransferase